MTKPPDQIVAAAIELVASVVLLNNTDPMTVNPLPIKRFLLTASPPNGQIDPFWTAVESVILVTLKGLAVVIDPITEIPLEKVPKPIKFKDPPQTIPFWETIPPDTCK